MMSPTLCVYALAGGGGAAGGGGGGGGGRSGAGYWGTYSNNYTYTGSHGEIKHRALHHDRGVYFYIGALIFLVLLVLWLKVWKPRILDKKYSNTMDIGDDNLSQEIEMTFLEIQSAWTSKDLYKVKHRYSSNLFKKHSEVLKRLSNNHKTNVTTNVTVEGLSSVAKKNTSVDVDVSFTAVDYLIDDKNNEIVAGDPLNPKKYRQRWYFVYENNALVVRKIKELQTN